ncbi:MAG TPA: NlpC/P60 family protein [Gaiellaceae bacterium]|nr:NlpC/P60 family protein [Gaiellaceae bacterium]
MTGQTATGGSVRGRERVPTRASTTGWTPTVVVLAALAAAFFGAVGPASADPAISSKRAQAQAILAQVRELDMEVARAAEAWNYANIQLARLDRELSQNKRHLVAARRSLVVAQNRIEERLRDLYINGESDSALEVILGASSLDDVIAGLDALQRVSAQDRSILEAVKRYRREVEARRARLTEARKEQAQVVAERAAQKRSIEARLAERRRMLASVREEIERLEAEERRRQALLAAQARARLAAQRQAALQAQARADAEAQAAAAALPETLDAPTGAPPPDGDKASQVVAIAMQYLGVPYVWGGSSPSTGFDCSGFSMFVFAQVGISLPHHAASQYRLGVPVAKSELQPADLVFFDGLGHMGIYIGGGQFIHAPHTGDVVKISSLSDSWYAATYVGARRIL